MGLSIYKRDELPSNGAVVYVIANKEAELSGNFTNAIKTHIKKEWENDINPVELFHNGQKSFVYYAEKGKQNKQEEKARRAAFGIEGILTKHKYVSVTITAGTDAAGTAIAFAQGIMLSSYRFLKYFTKPDKKQSSVKEVCMVSEAISEKQILELKYLMVATWKVKDMINEPVSYLTAPKLAETLTEMANDAGMIVDVFDKKKLETLKMGGILAVNKGSVQPPNMTILEWKPENAVNSKPIVLVGKGIVYDTGGLSLKPTPNSMDIMKCDMGGGATVAGAIYAVAKNKLPVHVIALVPATDNRPGGDAYAPGDVVTMYGGKTVEVLNTDAEGRMILADALTFAQKYEPDLVMDMATLTGAALIAIGTQAAAIMGTSAKDINLLKQVGESTYERMAELPFWDEYGEMIKSDIADMKNIGGRNAGTITAGKFLEHFTNYPWIHIDIAGPAWNDGADSYRGKGASGFGVRAIYSFIKEKYKL